MPARTSSPIPAAPEQLGSQAVVLVPDDVVDLRRFLIHVADPRDRRGRRYPVLALLCATVAAVLTGARSLIAISEWITDAPQQVLDALGFDLDPFTGLRPVPHAATVRRHREEVEIRAIWRTRRSEAYPSSGRRPRASNERHGCWSTAGVRHDSPLSFAGPALTGHVTAFAKLLAHHEHPTGEHAALQEWIVAVTADDLPALHGFVRGLQKDRAAVQAGLDLPYSNGATKGINNKTKLRKRQTYGRARFALLRQRILLNQHISPVAPITGYENLV